MFKTRTKSERFVIALGILGLFSLILYILLGLLKLYFSSYFARADWNDICSKIKNKQVVEVTYNIDVASLAKSDYKKRLSNEVSPPTPDNIICVKFSDGSKATLENWGSKTFAVRYKDGYYLIDNLKLFEQLKSPDNIP